MKAQIDIYDEEIERKLKLAELTIELGQVTRDKLEIVEKMTNISNKEKRLIKEIAKATEALQEPNNDVSYRKN